MHRGLRLYAKISQYLFDYSRILITWIMGKGLRLVFKIMKLQIPLNIDKNNVHLVTKSKIVE